MVRTRRAFSAEFKREAEQRDVQRAAFSRSADAWSGFVRSMVGPHQVQRATVASASAASALLRPPTAGH